jgi:hypothetical protein
MKKYLLLSVIAIIAVYALFSGSDSNAIPQGVVQGLDAQDVLNDDGTGILLKWKPLHRSNRIIQYKIYRGANPDSLFLLSSIDVDPKLGVLGDQMTFLDKDYLTLFDFSTAPAKLKKEKHQPANSPIYRGVPRDPDIIARLMDHYSMISVLSSGAYYRKSRLVVQDSVATAGLKINQMDYILANPLTDHRYYYSVIAVNEKGRHNPAAPIVSAVPVDNRPDNTVTIQTTYISDTKEIGFEWNPSSVSADIVSYEAWMLPKEKLEQFKQDNEFNLTAPDSIFKATWQTGLKPLFTFDVTYGASTYYHKVDLAKAGFDPGPEPEKYIPVFVYMDASGYKNCSLGHELRIRTSSQANPLPAFSIHDKKNDKGDNNIVSLGTPVAFVTQASFINAKKTRLRVTYEMMENETMPVERVRFRFTDNQGKLIREVTEYLPDKVFFMNISNRPDSFRMESTVMLRGQKSFGKDSAQQDIIYEEVTRRYAGRHLSIGGKRLENTFFEVYTRSRLGQEFSPAISSNGMVRTIEHTIPYEDTQQLMIAGYDKASKRLLFDPTITVAVHPDSGWAFSGPLYRAEFEKHLKDMRALIPELQASIKAGEAELPGLSGKAADSLRTDLEQKRAELRDTQNTIAFITSHPAYKNASATRGQRAWLKTLLKEYDRNSRAYAYQLLVSDGHGMFTQSDTFARGTNIWFHPESEWFDTTKLATLLGTFIFGIMIIYAMWATRRKNLYIRPIAGLEELDNAVGRATEMGRPVMFVPGWGSLGEPCTISSMMILYQIARKTAEFDVRLISPHVDYFVVPLAQEMVHSAYSEAGRPDAYDQNDIFFATDTQFAYTAAVNGITIRERVATIFYMGYFYAEALLMTETGNQAGAIQIAATDAVTQVPFFITTCDYTLIGEEFYAAGAYMSHNFELLSMLKAQDYFKLMIVLLVTVGAILSTLHVNFFLNFLPFE